MSPNKKKKKEKKKRKKPLGGGPTRIVWPIEKGQQQRKPCRSTSRQKKNDAFPGGERIQEIYHTPVKLFSFKKKNQKPPRQKKNKGQEVRGTAPPANG